MQRKLVATLLLSSWLVAGCVRGVGSLPASARIPPVPSPVTNSPGEQDHKSEQLPQVDSLSCSEGDILSKAELLTLLVRVSRYAPLADLTGSALEVERQLLAYYEAGWPQEPYTWVSNPWIGTEVVGATDGGFILTLQHGLYTTQTDRFQVSCSGGQWKVQAHAVGNDGDWIEQAQELPGQRGELTAPLAAALLDRIHHTRGPWFAQAATGVLLEWELERELNLARGLKAPWLPWPNPTHLIDPGKLAIEQVDERNARVTMLPGGRDLLYTKADGLWKIVNYESEGVWLESPNNSSPRPHGPIFDPPFGVLVGKTTVAEILQLFGPPDLVQQSAGGQSYTYSLRLIHVDFDMEGRVSALSLQAGAPNSGVRVGSPVAQWELIYGSGAAKDQPFQQMRYRAVDGKIVEITVTSK